VLLWRTVHHPQLPLSLSLSTHSYMKVCGSNGTTRMSSLFAILVVTFKEAVCT
jgi:hypothetical protein